ncbi:MAG: flagellar hook-length control protein FliK, partial [Pseudomonadota bacterium]|nr:flagellar hook-length control protein FliK [Pseudomonadota bacterium]
SEDMPAGDFRHLLQSQVAAPPHTGAVAERNLSETQDMPRLALHDRSREIGRVILTGGDQTGQDSQLTQFMRDHGFSEGGMAGYMKQTMLGAGATVAKTSDEPGPMPVQELGEIPVTTDPLDAALIEPNLAAMALGAASISSQPLDTTNGVSSSTLVKPEAALSSEAKVLPNAASDLPILMRNEALADQALQPVSTKELLTAQWPQVADDQRHAAAAQAAALESGELDIEFANQQQSGQRSGQGEQPATFTQNNPALNEEAQNKAQQYREWSERFSEMLGTRLAVAVREGSWSVQLDLDAMDLGSVAIQLHAGKDGIQGSVTSSDPVVRQVLSESLPKLQAALESALSDKLDNPAVSLSLGTNQHLSAEAFKTITLSAQELAQALPADFKAGDGLNVFV